MAGLKDGMTRASYALRLQAEVERVARKQGTTLNQLINVAEKLSALRTADYFRERAVRADLAGAEAQLDGFGVEAPAREGDELG